ncbi:MAG: hypothetical protein QNK36_10530 [Colwellia sp.]|nr:hypothetical protein [Colwellia sp.]
MSKKEFEPENYFDGYNESIENLKNKPETLEIDMLFYQVFETPNGIKLQQEIDRRIIMPAMSNINSSNFSQDLIYTEGYKDAFRFIRKCVESHRQRIATENVKNA